MNADRRPAIPNLRQELLFESAIEELSQWCPGSVDIENALHSLSTIRDLRPAQAMSVLGLARKNIESWMEVKVDPEKVIDTLAPSFRAYRQHLSQKGNPDIEKDYLETASTILSGVIENNPENYRKTVAAPLRKGVFGQPAIVLARLLKKPLEIVKAGGTIWDDEFDDYENLAVMLGDLVKMGDQSAIDSLKPHLPVAFMRHNIAYYDLSVDPRVKDLLESAAKDYPSDIEKLAKNYLDFDEVKQEELREMTLEGQFGPPAAGALAIISAIIENDEQADPEAKATIEETIQDLWVGLLDMDRSDIGLRPIREMIITKPWYWENDAAAYTAIESLEGLDIEEEEFVERYGDLMLDTIKSNLSSKEKKALKIPSDDPKEEVKQRLVEILKELRQEDTSSEDALFRNLSDRQLAIRLYSPEK
ncbi:MAG: hypothetical protein Q8P89_00730 [bacterium]|nr:hypothetical protein [bacterium]